MEKMLLTIFGIAFLSVLSDAQDIGRMRRMMLLRQRELALRRGGFPFGMRGIGGPGIPPPVAARLALMQRQRALQTALSNPFLRTSLGPMGSPFSPFSSRTGFGLMGPFGPAVNFPGPTDIGPFDLSTIGFPGGQSFGDSDGLTVVGTDGFTTVGNSGQPGTNEQQGGSGNIFGQQPTQAAEFLETNPGTVEARSGNDGRTTSQSSRPLPRSGFRPRDAGATASRPEAQRMQRFPNGPGSDRGPRSQQPEEALPSPPRPPPHLPPPLPPPVFPRPRNMIFPPMQQVQQPFVPLEPRLSPFPPRRRGRNQQRSRRPQRQRRGRRPRGPRVFPNVPDVVQIPAVTPVTQGQAGDGQMGTGLTQAAPDQMSGQSGGQMGGQQGGPVPGQFGGQMGGQQGGSMPGQFGGQMGGQQGGPLPGQFGGQMGGQQAGPVPGQFGGQMGGQQAGPMPGQFGGPVGSTFGGQMSGPFGSQMSGPTFSFAQPSGGQFSTGFQPQGVQGSAIFPSQAAQGPIMRQRGPSFTADSSFTAGSPPTVIPGFPNGPALQFPGGVQSFGPSDQFMFQAGGLTPEVFTTGEFPSRGFPGFPGASFGPRFEGAPPGAASGGQAATGQSLGGSGGQSQMAPNFGFVPPSRSATGPAFNNAASNSATGPAFNNAASNSAAGPAFNTGATSSQQNFNIQFQPLRPVQQIPQIPEQQPNPIQMGIGTGVQSNSGLNNGISSQSGIQFGSSSGASFQGSSTTQDGIRFGGQSQTGFQTGSTGQNSQFTNTGSKPVVVTKTNQQGDGTLSFGSGTQSTQSIDSAATTVSERTVETGASGGSTEFHLVEVGNILGDKGFVASGASTGSVVTTENAGGQQVSDFQPAGDISAAFQSFGAVEGSENVVDLSLQPDVTTGTGSTTDQSSAMVAGVSETNTGGSTIVTGSTTVTDTSEANSAISFEGGPFAPSIKQDFSFFIEENNQAPNEMPPVTFTAPEPPAPELPVQGSQEMPPITFTAPEPAILGPPEMPPITFTAPEPPAPELSVQGSQGTQILTFPVQGTAATGVDTSNTSQPGFSFNTNTVAFTEGKTATGPVQSGTTAVAGETNTAIGGFL